MDAQVSQFYRQPKKLNGKLVFQAFHWEEINEKPELARNGDPFNQETRDDVVPVTDVYVIRCFGATGKGRSVSLSIEHFHPYFYISPIDDDATPQHFKSVVAALKRKLRNVRNPNDRDDRALYDYSSCFVAQECEFEERVNFFGYHAGEKTGVYKLVFNNTDAMTKAIRIFKNAGRYSEREAVLNRRYKLFETKISPLVRFMHTLEITPCGWLSISRNFLRESEPGKFSCQMNFVASIEHIRAVERDEIAPFIQASFDLEVYSSVPDPNNPRHRLFPQPYVPGNFVTHIATSFKRYGDKDFFLNHILVLGKCAPIRDEPNIVITECESEKELLLNWTELIKNIDPDIFYSWNGDKFDWNYLFERAKINRCLSEFARFGRSEDLCEIKEEKFESSAYGINKYNRAYPCGRLNFDVMIHFQRNQKLESYKLDNIAEKFLGEKKHPVSAQEMFEAFDSKDPEKMMRISHYCVQDTRLPQRLVDKMSVLANEIEMSNVTFVPLQWLPVRGQSVKVLSQIVKRTMREGFVIPTLEPGKEAGSFKGATVLKATPGAYWDPIVTLDFASLYPSIMRAHNFCYSTFIDPNDPEHQKYANDPNVEFHTVEWIEKVPKLDANGEPLKPPKAPRKRKVAAADAAEPADNDSDDDPGDHFNKYGEAEVEIRDENSILLPGEEEYLELKHYKYKFAKWKLDKNGQRTGEKVKSILPGLLSDLAIWRKNAKRLMAAERDEFKKSVYNGRQLALKVSMNSVYGFLAAYTLRCRPIAACVTTTGRQMIEQTRDFVEKDFPEWAHQNGYPELRSEVVYGDSVIAETPILYQQDGKIRIAPISEIYDAEWTPYHDGKLQRNLAGKNLKVMTEYGWCDMRRIIKHKLAPEKRLFEVFADTGCVVVTEDHSLLTPELTEVKPATLISQPETQLLCHRNRNPSTNIDSLSEIGAYELGQKRVLDQRILEADKALKLNYLRGWRSTEPQCSRRHSK